jgi:hypothetical protein
MRQTFRHPAQISAKILECKLVEAADGSYRREGILDLARGETQSQQHDIPASRSR